MTEHTPETDGDAAPDPAIASQPEAGHAADRERRPRSRLEMTPTERRRSEERAQRLLRIGLRASYLTILVVVSLLPFVAYNTDDEIDYRLWGLAFPTTFAFGVIILIIDALTPNKRLSNVFATYFGLVAGMVAALAVGTVIDLIAESWDLTTVEWKGYTLLIKLAIGITLCYLAVSIVLTTKDDLRLVIPYVEFKREVRGTRPVLLDTSALIDGRVEAVGRVGFMDAPLIVPQFVVDELQRLSDSSDRTKRSRGRRGLDALRRIQTSPTIDLTIDAEEAGGVSVDAKLVQLAKRENYRVMTTDYNLNKVASVQDVTVLNLNDLASELRPQLITGDTLDVEIVKPGEAEGQGVGYLPDGTMVVVEAADDRQGDTVPATVTNVLQTSAGRMVFARIDDDRLPAAERLADRATAQPRGTTRPERRTARSAGRGRNPRRG